MKKVLIISPYFPPANAPDMQRIRMSLPYFNALGWQAEVVTVAEETQAFPLDDLLLESIPKDTIIHQVNSFPKKWTSKFGLGSLALRSLWFYKQTVNQILKSKKFDLIYFSTTQFPVCILGAYWKNKFGIPYVIDMQDPWHSDYYEDKLKHEQPHKYWFSYRLNKWLEPMAMKQVDGLIAVSKDYINELNNRYLETKKVPAAIITFGYSDIDLAIAKQLHTSPKNTKEIKYIGVLGPMMNKNLDLLFRNLPEQLKNEYHLIFKGTSYASAAIAKQSTLSFQGKYNLKNVKENTTRIGMFEVLKELSTAAGLLIIGTDDAGYTASKLYPYLQVNKPILAVLHPESSAVEILANTSNAIIISLADDDKVVTSKLKEFLMMITHNTYAVDFEKLKEFSALEMTRKQCVLFDKVIIHYTKSALVKGSNTILTNN